MLKNNQQKKCICTSNEEMCINCAVPSQPSSVPVELPTHPSGLQINPLFEKQAIAQIESNHEASPKVEEWKDSWHRFWNEESKNCEQKYLTPDTHGIIKDFISSLLLQKEEEHKREVEEVRNEVVEEIKSKLPTLRKGEYYESGWLNGFNYYMEKTRDIIKGIEIK